MVRKVPGRAIKAPSSSPRGNMGGFVTHNRDWDTLLVRVDQRLWGMYRQAVKKREVKEIKGLWAAIERVVEAKREFRAGKKGGSGHGGKAK